ncbi:MAG: glycosyltransferase [Neptuniibacter sp.]
MPAYNAENYISDAIDSVLSQTFENWELLIVDDCSSDNTLSIISRYASDQRIKLLKNSKNLGGAGARNRAIEIAVGRYIAFLDSDDMWVSDKLERQLFAMEKSEVPLSFGDYEIVNEEGEFIDRIKAPSSVTLSAMLKHNYIACLTAMYDTEKVGKIFMPLVRKRQDFALWIQILKICNSAQGVSGSLGKYRVRPGSLSESKKDALYFYWKVLREVAGCGIAGAVYNVVCYLGIVFFKKKLPFIYNKMVNRNG